MDIIDELINKIQKSKDKKICTMHKIFRETAEELMNNYVLKFGEHEVEPVEIEFYFHMCGKHEDPSIHASIEQICTKGELYFHSKGRGGVDLTFGDPVHHIIGGILLKKVKIKDAFVGQLEAGKELKNFSKENQLTLKDTEKSVKHHIYTSSRIGLQIKKDEDGSGEDAKRFADAPYRFVRGDLMNARKDNRVEKVTELCAIYKKQKGESMGKCEKKKYEDKFEKEGCFE